MTSDTLSCPYCNAFLPAVSAEGGPNPLLHCPRCGEKLPPRLMQAIEARAALTPRSAGEAEGDDPAESPQPEDADRARDAAQRRALGRSLLVVLMIMAAMVVLALSFSWSTEDFRRIQDLQRPVRPRLNVRILLTGLILVASWSWLYVTALSFVRKQQGTPAPRQEVWELIVFVLGLMALVLLLFALPSSRPHSEGQNGPLTRALDPPLVPAYELPALSYLPEQTGLLLAVRVADAEKTAAGKEFLRHGQIGPLALGGELEKWSGVPLADIDHAVLGLKDNRLLLPPPLVLVVKTRRAVELDKVRQAVKSKRSSQVGQRTLHHFNVMAGKLSLEAVLWFAPPDTLVVGISKGDLEAIAEKPSPGPPLTQPLQAFLRERVDPMAQVVLAGHAENWEPLALVLPKDDFETLALIRQFGFSLRFDPGVRLAGVVCCPTDAAARALAMRWAALKAPEEDTVPKEWLPLVRELAASYRCERKENWLNLNAQAGAEAVNKALQK